MFTTDVVIAEVAWTLIAPSRYGLAKTAVREALLPLLSLPGLEVPSRDAFIAALDLFVEANISFTDAFNAAVMRERSITTIYSYDRDFDRISDVQRIEP